MVVLIITWAVACSAAAALIAWKVAHARGVTVGRKKERAKHEREERERQVALTALGGNDPACPYVMIAKGATPPCGHVGLSASKKPIVQMVISCQDGRRRSTCRYPHGDHIHSTCSLCEFEWLERID